VAGGRFKVIAVPHDADSASSAATESGDFSRAGSFKRGGTIVKVDKELYALPARDRIAAAELVVVTVHTDTNVLGRGFVCVPCRGGLYGMHAAVLCGVVYGVTVWVLWCVVCGVWGGERTVCGCCGVWCERGRGDCVW
jgi:hypothetical protein